MVRVNTGVSSSVVPIPARFVRTIASSVPTSDPSYFLPLRPKVTISSNDGTIVYFIYDSFLTDVGSFAGATFSTQSFSYGNESYAYQSGSFISTSFFQVSFTQTTDPTVYNNPQYITPEGDAGSNPNRIRILRVTVDIALNQSGTFSVMVEDSAKTVDRNVIGLGCRFDIAVGKTAAEYKDVIHGYCKVVETKRDDTGLLVYVFSGYGSQIIFNERIVDFQKQAARIALGSNVASLIDPNVNAFQMVRSLIEGHSALPIKGLPSLKEQTGLTEDGLDPRVDTFIPAISQPLVQASQVMDTICNESGAIWGVQNGDVFFRYPTQVHTGVVIKDSHEPTDPVNKTSYFIGPWEFTDSIDLQDGFCNGLYLKGGTLDPTADVQSTTTGGSTSLYNKDIAQQVIPGSARLKNLALMLQKLGSGGSLHQQFVTGAVVHDSNGKPTGSKILDLQIPVTSINTTPTAVFDFNAKFSVKDIQVDAPLWIVLYAKGTSEDNTIRWLHDGNTSNDAHYSSTRPVNLDPSTEDRVTPPLKPDITGWVVSSTGPTYTHAFFKGIRALAYASDPQSRARYGLVEAVHDISWIQDNATLQTYASNVLQALAKPIRKFTMQQVTIPNDFVFLPGQLVDIVDTLSGIVAPKSLSAEIQEVKYDFQAPSSSGGDTRSSAPSNSPGQGGGTHALGTNYAEIMPITYVDFLSSGL
jgi:hypothetical protein